MAITNLVSVPGILRTELTKGKLGSLTWAILLPPVSLDVYTIYSSLPYHSSYMSLMLSIA
jgi:hypothetical protein